MSNEKTQTGSTPVGALLTGDPHIEEITKNNNVGANCVRPNSRGITLIALIITIIIMLILVGVSVTVALNGGLFRTAKEASDETAVEKDKEYTLSSGQIEVDGKTYLSYEDYLNDNPIPEGWIKAETKPDGWSENAIAIQEKTTGKIIPLPKGFKVSTVETEDSIEEGLVITDGQNEFVWIPVDDENSFVNPYNNDVYSEPKTVSDDTQTNLDTYYGTKEDGTTPYYTLETDFAYSDHYAEMVESVNKYNGFFVGRYETTIDSERNVGTEYNTEVLTAGTTYTNNSTTYSYRWWGLYYAQRNTDSIVGNGSIVQSNMIWGQQWDAMLSYFGTLSLDYSATPVSNLSSESKVVNSGQAEYSYNEETINDEIYNIYDLRRNAYEWTAEADSTKTRVRRGGNKEASLSASYRYGMGGSPYNIYPSQSSRLTLYIK